MTKLEFEGSQGHTLSARLDKPEGKIIGYALFAHCFTCTKDIFAASYISKALVEQNIAVLRFDFTGLGHSDGDFENTNFSSNINDLIKAADYLRETEKAPSILIGHSLGGAAVIAAAHSIPEAKAVVTIGAPSDSKHVAHNFQEKIEEILTNGQAEVCLVGRPFIIKKQFIDDIQNQKMNDHISNLKKALMVFHAPRDETVGIENAGEIFSQAKHPKSYVSLDNADHILSKKEDAIYVGNIIAKWAERYL